MCVSSYFGLEAAEELGQVRVLSGQRQDPLLGQGAVHVVVLQDHVFLQHFDGVDLVGAFQLRQHHLVQRQRSSQSMDGAVRIKKRVERSPFQSFLSPEL